ncbi:ribosome-releasing factor 2, mitochondrial isoform X3 [Dendroctonus ponderosae]|uniref:ribosome-releasing factor 2, mitochondrial isoform X3 n=1 Tax=Dendroctonus ponderosae TaxID=77166 RepID=UPI0020359706|nr:ribosome-releasing factor 2, mitochondrial isoform X3 [Dendroctonus ponderosae]
MVLQVPGVEAQTLTVWRQADRYNLPRIIYVNKMDRADSDIHMCCSSIEKKFDLAALLLQLPARAGGKLTGVVDVLSLELFQYGNSRAKGVSVVDLSEETHPQLFADAQQARVRLIEQLTEHDDELANKVIASESFETVSSQEIIKALQKVTQDRVAVPVVLGSSYKNIGVQNLMDAVIHYLPTPQRSSKIFSAFEDAFCGRAFKVKHDKQKGPLVFVRLYNGSIRKGQKIFSVQRSESEQVGRLYVAYADDFQEVESLGSGNIAVLSGLKKTLSGDLVTTSQTAYDRAGKNVLKAQKKSDAPLQVSADSLFGVGARIPEPVFFCSIEPPSMSSQQALDQALTELQREDPSLRVSYNAETGQTVLAGMGELHLEIIRDRILKEYKVDADLGPLQIAYREAPLDSVTESTTVDIKIGSHKNHVLVKMSLIPTVNYTSEDLLKFDKNADNASNISAIYPKHLQAIRQGVTVGLAQGPKINSQVINTHVMLHWFEVGRGTSETIIASTVTQLVQKLVKLSGTRILEPVMALEIVTPPEHLSSIMADLSRRRTNINSVTMRGKAQVVTASVPLAELLGYSSDLRIISSGTAMFTTEFEEYRRMSSSDEEEAIRSVRGF